MRGLIALFALSLSCGGGSLKSNGEQCVSSSECNAGLICDTTQTPHVCAGTSLVDAPEFHDAAIDAEHAIDAAPPVDGHVTPDAHVVDAATPDAAIDAAPAIDAPPPFDAAPAVDATVPPADV